MILDLIPEHLAAGVPCKGSPASQALRNARAHEAATRAILRTAALKAHAIGERYVLGRPSENTVQELLEDTAMESMSVEWFARKSAHILYEIASAAALRDEGEDDEDLEPEKPAWAPLKELSLALSNQSEALKNLHITEKTALTQP
jgi:hypothetical protein